MYPYPNQSLFDLAVQHCGSAEAAYDLAVANGISITDNTDPDTPLNSVPIIQPGIVTLFATLRHIPATA